MLYFNDFQMYIFHTPTIFILMPTDGLAQFLSSWMWSCFLQKHYLQLFLCLPVLPRVRIDSDFGTYYIIKIRQELVKFVTGHIIYSWETGLKTVLGIWKDRNIPMKRVAKQKKA